jgi:hypothetical protein
MTRQKRTRRVVLIAALGAVVLVAGCAGSGAAQLTRGVHG